jgi:dipeptidase E
MLEYRILYFEIGEVKQVVSLDENSNAYFVTLTEGEVKETVLQKVLLPPAWP